MSPLPELFGEKICLKRNLCFTCLMVLYNPCSKQLTPPLGVSNEQQKQLSHFFKVATCCRSVSHFEIHVSCSRYNDLVDHHFKSKRNLWWVDPGWTPSTHQATLSLFSSAGQETENLMKGLWVEIRIERSLSNYLSWAK